MFPSKFRFAPVAALLCCVLLCTARGDGAESITLSVALIEPSVRLVSDVVYAQKPKRGYPSVALKMDILQPEVETPLPAVVFIPGGGLINANKDSFAQQRMRMAEAGYVVASIEYRVAPTVLFPAPLEDVKSAIRYLRANSGKFGIDPGKIAVFGNSAGGYLAALAGTTNGMKQFDVDAHLDQSSEVAAAIDFFGLTDLTRIGEGYPEEVQKLHDMPSATEALWVNGATPFFQGGSIHDFPDKAAAANPITHISGSTAPFLIMHGDKDTSVSPRQSERLHEALVEKDIESTLYIVEGAPHGGIYWLQPDVMDIVIAFLDKHLK